jgi:hypothetical protein
MRWEDIERERSRKNNARHDELKDYLLARGYTLIGEGRDQLAFDEPQTGLVLKIFKNETGQKNDPAQRMLQAWINYCERNANNSFLPKFHGSAQFEYKGVDYWQFRMEKLKPAGKMAVAIGDLSEAIEYPSSKYYKQGFTWPEYKLAEPEYARILEMLGDQLPTLIKTLEDLLHRAGQKWILDTHKENVMARTDNWPVIVDPWQLY